MYVGGFWVAFRHTREIDIPLYANFKSNIHAFVFLELGCGWYFEEGSNRISDQSTQSTN
jgi:hypothetical protein